MKELHGYATTLLLFPDINRPPKMLAFLDLALVCSEANYSFSGGDKKLLLIREPTTTRIVASPLMLREMADSLIKWADEADSLEKALNEATDRSAK